MRSERGVAGEALVSEEDFVAEGQEGEQRQVKAGRPSEVESIEVVIERLEGQQLDPVVEVPEHEVNRTQAIQLDRDGVERG